MIKKILVINPFGIGDVIFSLTLVEALKSALPQISIGFLGNERTSELLRVDSSIDRVHEFNRDELRAKLKKNYFAYMACVWRYVREIQKENYDTVIDLSLGREFSFVAFCLGIRRRIGFDYKKRGLFLSHKSPLASYENKSVTEWQLSLLNFLGLDRPIKLLPIPFRISAGNAQQARLALEALPPGADAPIFAVAPGGGKSWGENAIYKQWSLDRFVAVADAWAEQTRSSILILGDQGEVSLLENMKKKLKAPSLVISNFSLPVVCALLKQIKFLLCNDGGLLHLANAMGVKTVSIFGPVDEVVYGPYGNETPHVVLTQPVPCRPCYKNFNFPPCSYERRCLEELPIEKVLDAIKKIS